VHAGFLWQVYYQGKKAIDYNAEFFFYDMMLVSNLAHRMCSGTQCQGDPVQLAKHKCSAASSVLPVPRALVNCKLHNKSTAWQAYARCKFTN